jgi:hypothetical protein
MIWRDFLEWFHNKIHNYNLFIPDENEYDELEDPITIIKYQKYATRLYVPLFISKYIDSINQM